MEGKKKPGVEGKVKSNDKREQEEEEGVEERSKGRKMEGVDARGDKWEVIMLEEEGKRKRGRQKVKGRRKKKGGGRGRRRMERVRDRMLKIGRG